MTRKTLEDYLKMSYRIEVFRDTDPNHAGWVARVAELPGCITQGDTFEELGEMIQDAMRMWIGTALEDGIDIPEPQVEEKYSGKFIVRVPKSLHRELVETAKREGVSLNLYVTTALGKAVGTFSASSEEDLLEKNVRLSRRSIRQSILASPKSKRA